MEEGHHHGEGHSHILKAGHTGDKYMRMRTCLVNSTEVHN
jgi:hypothetical protein